MFLRACALNRIYIFFPWCISCVDYFSIFLLDVAFERICSQEYDRHFECEITQPKFI